MVDILVHFLTVAHYELLLFAVAGLLIGGLDDIVLDMLYFMRAGWRHIAIYSRHARKAVADLPPSTDPSPIAIFIPAWQEAAVIERMLLVALRRWGEGNYHLFAGAYPNDPPTLAAIASAASQDARIILTVNERDGPTTKADNLNAMWRGMVRMEAETGRRFKAVVLHDAEDVVHRDELRVYDSLIDRFGLIQLPVLPMVVERGLWSRLISGHYVDEFAENHGKALVVREAVGAAMPSAGVASAFRRDVLERLAGRDGCPFDAGSLTEDYETGLRITGDTGRGVFVRIRDGAGGLVATRAYFPATWESAIRQKTRWTVGIALAGWDRTGWSGGVGETWMRLRDRRALLAALILSAAYLQLILWAALHLIGTIRPVPQLDYPPTLLIAVDITFLFLVWRIAIRALFVWRYHGWAQALWSVPRTFIANIIAILAAGRALDQYIRSLFGKPLVWDKTEHHFPDMQALEP